MNEKQSKYAASMLSGILSVGINHPLDTLRIRYHLLNHVSEQNMKSVNVANSVGTLKSLMNGIGFNIASTCFKNVVSYPLREQIGNTIKEHHHNDLVVNMTSSTITGIIMAAINTPVNIVKIQLQHDHASKNTLKNVMKEIYDSNGVKSFYKGGLVTLCRDVSWNVIYFPMFDIVTKKLNYYNNYYSLNMLDVRPLSSIMCSMAATTVAYPFDGLRIFRQRLNNNIEYDFWVGIKKSFSLSKANIKSYTYAMIRVPLATCITHIGYIYFSEYLKNK